MSRINVDEPLWDQSKFTGRFKHFMWVTDPLVGLCSEKELYDAKKLVEQYRKGTEPSGTTRDQIVYAKKLYESAFHPDTGDLQNVFGRMSFQLPGGMLITGGMLQWYRTVRAVIFWQWINQSFNALVNYTNRNAKSPINTTQLVMCYVSATTSAMVTAIGLKQYLATRATPLLQRFVPFAAVAAANCVNIPLMRNLEVLNGIEVQDENGKIVTVSKYAAVKGISQVVFSRIVMATPGMTILPVIMEKAEQMEFMKKITYLHGPIQVLACGIFLVIMVPTACALFPQKCSIKASTLSMLESENYEKLKKNTGGRIPEKLYFNKGL